MQSTKIPEEWKAVEGYPGYYISNHGRFRTIDRITGGKRKMIIKGKMMKLTVDSLGYCIISLYKNGKSKKVRIHQLVAMAFIENPENKPEVNHIDCNRTNNIISNLEWVTRKENLVHAANLGRSTWGDKNVHAKLTNDDAKRIRKLSAEGLRRQQIAQMYPQVSKYTVYRVIKRETFRNI